MIKKLLTLIVCMLMSSTVWADSITVPQSTLYPYQNTIELQDEFLSGTTSSPGSLGFSLLGGTTTLLTSVTNRLGIYRRDTTAVISTVTAIFLYNSGLAVDPSNSSQLTWIVRLNTNDVNTTIRIGTMNAVNGNPPTHGNYLEKLDADTNWFCVTRAGGVQTRVDSTVAVTTNFDTFNRTTNSSGVQFNINNVNVCSVITTNIPTTFVVPAVHIINSAAASKTFDVDYFQLRILGLVR